SFAHKQCRHIAEHLQQMASLLQNATSTARRAYPQNRRQTCGVQNERDASGVVGSPSVLLPSPRSIRASNREFGRAFWRNDWPCCALVVALTDGTSEQCRRWIRFPEASPANSVEVPEASWRAHLVRPTPGP